VDRSAPGKRPRKPIVRDDRTEEQSVSSPPGWVLWPHPPLEDAVPEPTDPLRDAAEACRRLGLTLEEVLPPGRLGPGVFMARVRTARGERLVLKRANPESRAFEIAALRAWSATGVTPRFVDEPEPGLYLVEWLDGTPLHEVADPPAAAVAVGRALRVLHGAAAPPAVCPDTRDQFAPDRRDWGSLPPELEAYRRRLAADILARHPTEDTLLHGDVVPAQVWLTGAGPRLVNPLGRRGLAAWDLGQLAAAAAGRGLPHLLPALLEGYGERPPLLDEMAGYGVLAYLQKNLAAGGSAAVARLEPLARALLRGGDPAAFVAERLS
jgi:hypothetical protein